MTNATIIKQAPNEFVFEFPTQDDAKQLKENVEFDHEGIKHKVIRCYPVFRGPVVYSFLVITDILKR